MNSHYVRFSRSTCLGAFFSTIAGLLVFSTLPVLAQSSKPRSAEKAAAPAAANARLKIALVSGSHSPAYLTDQSLALLKVHLERNFPMDCVLLTTNKADDGFINIEALDRADAAVFFVRRKTPNEHNLAILRRFFESGKGFVALRATSHAWENWPTFDVDVLGAKYEGTFAERNPMQTVYAHPHPIFTGAREFTTQQYMYQYGKPAEDCHILMQGKNASGTTPMAWTREYRGTRVFHFVPSHVDDFHNAAYLQIVANGVLWAARRDIPGAETIVQRTIMPESEPGAFAVVFPNGPGLCFDPVRGGINYLWSGEFLDVRPTWTGKVGQPAGLRGEVFYRESIPGSLRRDPKHAPQFQFKGYLMKHGLPEFQYLLDDTFVCEELRPLPGGAGVVRHFQTDAPDAVFWLHTGPQQTAICSAPNGTWEKGLLRVQADAAGAFSITIQQKESAE